jgi:MFS family permease
VGAILVLFLKVQTPKTPIIAGLKALDWFGSATIVGGTVMLSLGLNFGGVQYSWTSAIVLGLIVGGAVCYVLFLFIEYKIAPSPVIPFGIFNTRATYAPLLACFFHGAVLSISSYYLPLYFQSVLGSSPILSGVYILAYSIPVGISAAVSGGIVTATGKYIWFVYGGFALITLASGLFIDFPQGHEWAKIIIYQIILGVGIGPNFQALLVALQNNVHESDEATAVATFGFARNLAGSIGVVGGGVVFQNVIHGKYNSLAPFLGSTLANRITNGDYESAIFTVNDLPEVQRTIARAAYLDSVSKTWIFMTVMAGVGFLFALLIKEQFLTTEHKVIQTGLETEKKRAEMIAESRARNKADKVIAAPAPTV